MGSLVRFGQAVFACLSAATIDLFRTRCEYSLSCWSCPKSLHESSSSPGQEETMSSSVCDEGLTRTESVRRVEATVASEKAGRGTVSYSHSYVTK